MKRPTEIALLVSELDKARAALTVLYEQSAKDQKELAATLAKVEQRCNSSEARLKRIELALSGTLEDPGILTQLHELRKYKAEIVVKDIEETPTEEIVDSPGALKVHPAWIYVVIPFMFSAIVILAGALIFVLAR